MDWDNIGPIAVFIIYMAISAWSKQNKARQRTKPAEKIKKREPNPIAKPVQEVGGILEQLKKELFEIDEDPLVFQQEEPELELVEDLPDQPPVEPERVEPFVEGSPRLEHNQTSPIEITLDERVSARQRLDEVLEPYTRLEQGIILHEILGKPRARQENDDWFHKS